MRAVAVIDCSVEIGTSVEVVYQRWTSSGDIPVFLGGSGRQRHVEAASVDWVALVEGRSADFEAVVTEQVPERRIAWDGGPRSHAGVVTFEGAGDQRSRVRIELNWDNDGSTAVGDRLIVRRQLQHELESFRHGVESARSSPAEARPGGGDEQRPAGGATEAQTASADGGRGRTATSPTKVPPGGWIDILKRTVHQLKADNLSIIAAGVAFYVFLALVPALIAAISVYGLVADPADVSRQLDSFLGAVPTEAADLIRQQVETVAASSSAALGLGLAVSVAAALLGASKGMLALITALNVAYDEEETRKILKLRVLALLLTIALTLAAVVGVGSMVVVKNVASGLGTIAEIAVSVVRWPVLAALVVLGLAALYRYAPDRDAPAWRWVTPGALVATVLWLVGSIAFSLYANNFGSYNETYGSLAAVVVLLLWLFLTAYAIVLGAELDAEAERQTARDTTRGPERPLGQRDAYAADTVAS